MNNKTSRIDMKGLLLLFLTLVFANSCTPGDKTGTEQPEKATFYNISLEKPLDNAVAGKYQSASLSEIGGTISYIPLEVNANSVFNRIISFTMHDSSIFIKDVSKVLEFDISGRFVRQIGRLGKGPGEYNLAMSIIACDTFRCIYANRDRCLMYNPDGTLIKSFNLDRLLDAQEMLMMDDGMVAVRCINQSEHISSNTNSLFITDLSFNVIKTFKNYHKRKIKTQWVIKDIPFYQFQGKVRFKEWGVDTLYTVTADSLIPYALFDFGERAFPLDIMNTPNELERESEMGQYRNQWALMYIVEDAEHLFFKLCNYVDETGLKYGLYSKQTGTTKILKETGFQNNIDGGLPFFPRYVYNDSILVDWVDAYDLREQVLKTDATEMRKLYGQKYDVLLRLAKSLNDDSGTVLVLVKP